MCENNGLIFKFSVWTYVLFPSNIFYVYFYLLEKKKCRPDSVDCTPLDYILPGSNELPLIPLQPQSKDPKVFF